MKAVTLNERLLKLLFFSIFFFLFSDYSFAQPVLPQRTLSVTATQGIHFGTFCLTGGSGGTVTVGYAGERTSTGDILLLSINPTAHPSVFEIKLCEGRNVNITFDATTILNGSPEGTLTLDIGPTEKGPSGSSFSTKSDCNFITPLRIGGTLHVPGSAVPGIYTGSFAITFNQQ